MLYVAGLATRAPERATKEGMMPQPKDARRGRAKPVPGVDTKKKVAPTRTRAKAADAKGATPRQTSAGTDASRGNSRKAKAVVATTGVTSGNVPRKRVAPPPASHAAEGKAKRPTPPRATPATTARAGAIAPAKHAASTMAPAPPRYSVVCISRTLGSFGEAIGQDVAATLGYRYADEEIIVRAADEAGVPPQVVERVEQRPRLIERILNAMKLLSVAGEMRVAAGSAPTRSAEYERLIEGVIRETASEGKAVIVAHGASVSLGNHPGALRVLVTASQGVRVGRLASESGASPAQARKAIDDSDEARRDYLRRFYGVREEHPTHYDVVLNTDMLTESQAVQLIVSAARAAT